MKRADRTPEVELSTMIELEKELDNLMAQKGMEREHGWFIRFVDKMLALKEKFPPRPVDRKKYLQLALLTGWLGGHRFYAGHMLLGALYLLFFWTGIPFAMTVIDLMIALPLTPDDAGAIYV